MLKKSIGTLLLFLLFGAASAQSSVQASGERQQFAKGLELFQKGNYREARSTFDAFVDLYPESSNTADAEYYRASSALKMYHLDGEQLMTSFMSDYAWHPKAEYANYEMGLYYYQDRDYAKAIKYLGRAAKSGLSRTKKQEVNFKLGYSNFARKAFKKAQPSFDVLKRMANPYFDASNYYAAYIEIETNQFEKAIVDLKKIEGSEGYSRVVPYMLAGVYYKQERFQDVIEYLESKLDQPISEKKNATMLLADSYFRISQFEKASEAFDEYMSVGKGNPSAFVLFRMGYSYYRTEQDAKAIDSFKKMASKDTEIGVQASFYLAALYLKIENYQYAIPALDLSRQYLESPELKEEAQFLFGKANYAAGKYTDAIIALQEFLQKYPASSYYDDANDLLSEAFLHSSDYERAINHIEQQPRLSTNMQLAYQQAAFHRGAELYNMNKFKDAVDYFDKSIKYPLDNDFLIKTYYWKAEAYSRGNRYDEAIYPYQKVLFNAKAKETPYYLNSKYGLGYSYYNTKDYNSALTQFSDYSKLAGSKSGRYSDAIIRLADCHYVTKSYGEAVANYMIALGLKGGEKDYAHLQLGIIQGIIGQDELAFKHFDDLLNNYPKSRFVDDGLFEKGNLQFERGMYDLSVKTYNELIIQKNASRYLPFGLIRSAISYFNLKQYDRTASDYILFLEKFPGHKEGQNALLGLQEALGLINRSSEFEGYLTNYRSSNPETDGLEAVEYESIKTLYNNQEYTQAIDGFKKYIENYPGDKNVFEGRYYIGESYYRLGRWKEALPYYYQVVEDAKISQVLRSVQRIADLEFETTGYDQAALHYAQLLQKASNKRQEFSALNGLMKSNFYRGEYDSTQIYAAEILSKETAKTEVRVTANLFSAKAQYAQGNFPNAIEVLKEVVLSAQDENGAEAKYLIGEILHQQKSFAESNDLLFEFPEQFGVYTKWLDNTFLLIADNFIALEEYFQARATLSSIIENSEAISTQERAAAKIAIIDAAEKQLLEQVVNPLDSLDSLNNNNGNDD